MCATYVVGILRHKYTSTASFKNEYILHTYLRHRSFPASPPYHDACSTSSLSRLQLVTELPHFRPVVSAARNSDILAGPCLPLVQPARTQREEVTVSAPGGTERVVVALTGLFRHQLRAENVDGCSCLGSRFLDGTMRAYYVLRQERGDLEGSISGTCSSERQKQTWSLTLVYL